MENEKRIKIIALLISLVLVSIGYISKDPGIFGNLLLISFFLSFSVFTFFEYKHYREFKEMEEKFPIFLRDLTEAINAGMNLPRAIKTVSRYDYGALSKEIKKLSNQLSWNVPIHKALERFAERMKRSKRISTGVKIIKEAYLSGGNTVAILTSLSEALEILEQSEKERKSILSQYTLMVYAISLIFLAIVIAIVRLIIPIFSNPMMGAAGISDPCFSCSGGICSVCDFFYLTSKALFISESYVKTGKPFPFYYVSLFFYLSLIQAIFAGLVAGEISQGSIRAGIKHSLILTCIIVSAYLLLFRFGLIGVF